MVGPVIWNGPGGRLLTLLMRVSGPSVNGSPVPPVPNRNCWFGGRPGSPPGMVRMTAAGEVVGTPATSGGGSVVYGVLAAWPALMKKLPEPFGGAVILNWRPLAKFGPGEPSALTMPCDRRLS